MAKNQKDFRDKLTFLAEIAEKIESDEDFIDEDVVEVRVRLGKKKYDYILHHFREIDWNQEKFYINFGKVSFKFVLKK